MNNNITYWSAAVYINFSHGGNWNECWCVCVCVCGGGGGSIQQFPGQGTLDLCI